MIATCPLHPAFALTNPDSIARDLVGELGLQENLPDNKNALATPKTQPRPDSRDGHIADFLLSDALRYILYAAIALGIVCVIWSMRERLPAWGRGGLRTGKAPTASVPEAAVERMAAAQIEADELARQGRIAEAMHALLLRSLIEVRKRLAVNFADSLTSREVLRALTLPDTGKSSLEDIIRRVELVYFGEQAADDQDYAACRVSYERLTLAMGSRALA